MDDDPTKVECAVCKNYFYVGPGADHISCPYCKAQYDYYTSLGLCTLLPLTVVK